MSGYALHPEAFIDIDEIAVYIGQDSPEAAHRFGTREKGPTPAHQKLPTKGTPV